MHFACNIILISSRCTAWWSGNHSPDISSIHLALYRSYFNIVDYILYALLIYPHDYFVTNNLRFLIPSPFLIWHLDYNFYFILLRIVLQVLGWHCLTGLYRIQVHFYDTWSVYCNVCSSPRVRSSSVNHIFDPICLVNFFLIRIILMLEQIFKWICVLQRQHSQSGCVNEIWSLCTNIKSMRPWSQNAIIKGVLWRTHHGYKARRLSWKAYSLN